jgi:quinol monooxygenase YgiN
MLSLHSNISLKPKNNRAMKKNNFSAKKLLAVCISAALFSCNNSSETPKTDTNTAASASPATETAFVPFKVVLIKHTVADFDKWKPAFVEHASKRTEYGMTDLDLLRGIDNPNQVLIVEKTADVQKAKEFTTLPDLKDVMQKAGVTGPPEFAYYDVIRDDNTAIDTKDRVSVTHRVKDFDAWVKVYDGEGKAQRASEGMVDRVMARGIDDPNIVHLVFAVTDMAKAKAAITSENKKNIMMSAGVEGLPTIEYFRQAN